MTNRILDRLTLLLIPCVEGYSAHANSSAYRYRYGQLLSVLTAGTTYSALPVRHRVQLFPILQPATAILTNYQSRGCPYHNLSNNTDTVTLDTL